jgi:hypothetical protein
MAGSDELTESIRQRFECDLYDEGNSLITRMLNFSNPKSLGYKYEGKDPVDTELELLEQGSKFFGAHDRNTLCAAARKLGCEACCTVLTTKIKFLRGTENREDFSLAYLKKVFRQPQARQERLGFIARMHILRWLAERARFVIHALAHQQKTFLMGEVGINVMELCNTCDFFPMIIRGAEWSLRKKSLFLRWKESQTDEDSLIAFLCPEIGHYDRILENAERLIRQSIPAYTFGDKNRLAIDDSKQVATQSKPAHISLPFAANNSVSIRDFILSQFPEELRLSEKDKRVAVNRKIDRFEIYMRRDTGMPYPVIQGHIAKEGQAAMASQYNFTELMDRWSKFIKKDVSWEVRG